MVKCAITGCRNYNNRKRSLGSEKISFFRFPKNEFCKEWVKLCGNSSVETSTARICSIHFSNTAYREKTWIEKQFPDCSGHVRRLKDDAVPSKFLRLKSSSTGSKSVLSEINESHVTENSIIAQNNVSSSIGFVKSKSEDVIPAANFELENIDEQNLQLESLLQELEELKKKNKNLMKTFKLQDKMIVEKNKIIAAKEKILRKKEGTIVQKHITICEAQSQLKKYERILNEIFTPGQVKILTDKNRKLVKWNADDISSAISLHTVSPRAYRYLRDITKIPLPSISTLKRVVTEMRDKK